MAHPTDSGESQALSKQVMPCVSCGGSGLEVGLYDVHDCYFCKGQGEVKTAASECPDDTTKGSQNALNRETEDSNV